MEDMDTVADRTVAVVDTDLVENMGLFLAAVACKDLVEDTFYYSK